MPDCDTYLEFVEHYPKGVRLTAKGLYEYANLTHATVGLVFIGKHLFTGRDLDWWFTLLNQLPSKQQMVRALCRMGGIV
jgi:hypothetical protein